MDPQPKSSLLPVLLAVLGSGVVFGVAGYYIATSQQPEVNPDLYTFKHAASPKPKTVVSTTPAATSTPTPTSSPTTSSTDQTATWKTFKSSIVNLAFRYPLTSGYVEEDLKSTRPETVKSGHNVTFKDNKKTYPQFEAVTVDFKAEDSVPHDLIQGTLDSKNSFSVLVFEKGSEQINELAPGVYHYSGYANVECSSFTASHLFVKAPKNSSIKYIDFFLGNGKDFQDSDFTEPCVAKPDVIKQRLDALAQNKIPEVKAVLDKALAIAKTLTTK